MVILTGEVQTSWSGVVAANVVSHRAKTIYGSTGASCLTRLFFQIVQANSRSSRFG